MITITKKPTTAITGDVGNISKWVGAHQPIEFEVTRKDYSLSKVWIETFNGINYKVFDINGVHNIFQVGFKFTFICTLNQARSWSLVVDRVDFTATKTIVRIDRSKSYDTEFMVNNQSSILVEKKGYFIETFVYKAKENYQLELIGVLRAKNDVWGKATINIQKIVSSSLENSNKFTYDKINKPLPDEGGMYNVKMREVYEDNIGAFTSLLPTDVLYYVNGSKQLQEDNNFNFGEYVPTLNDSRVNKAKFLSVFDKPTYFNNYPFSLSFIYSDNVLNRQLKRNEDDVLTNLFVQGRGFVNRLMIAGGYASTVNEVSVHIEEDGTTTQNPTTGTGTYTSGDVFTGYTEKPFNRPPKTDFSQLFEQSRKPKEQ